MALETINRGTTAGDGTGDDLRTGAGKINDNFTKLGDRSNAFRLYNLGLNAGRKKSAKVEYQAVADTTEQTIIDVAGEGFVNQIFIAIEATNFLGRERSTLKVYIDGSATPSVNCTLARFFQVDYLPPAFDGPLFGGYSTGNFIYMRCSVPMPFTTNIKITVTANTALTYLFSTVEYNLNTSIKWGRMGHFKAVEFTDTAVAALARFTPLNLAAGAGNKGCFLGLYGRFDSANTNYSWLEGNVRYFYDGSGTADFESSGMEDYFLSGFYFNGYNGTTTSSTASVRSIHAGLLHKNDTARSIAAYRNHLLDPVYFDDGFKVDFQNGSAGQPTVGSQTSSTLDVAMCCYYYLGDDLP